MKLSRRKIAAMAIAGRDNAVMVRRSFVLDVIGFTTRRNILANVPSHRILLASGIRGCSAAEMPEVPKAEGLGPSAR